MGERRALTTEEFVTRAKEVHGDKYDYSKVEYKNKRTKVCIICPEHGEFFQTPHMHWRGSGCLKCGIERARAKRAKGTEQFVKEAKSVHGDNYDYSSVSYKSGDSPVIIICPEHGPFSQLPVNHIQGKQGCPACRESHLEAEVNLLLKNNNIKAERQKHFSFLGTQSLDFFLPEYNIAIECQGKQHFMPVKLFGGEKRFMETKERDSRKLKNCLENGIKMIYYAEKGSYVPEGVIVDKGELLKAIRNNSF